MNKMLSSWKEIAHYFGKGVRTVQRWEKTLNLPIRRPPGAPSNVVLARTSDLEEWMHRGQGQQVQMETGSGSVDNEFDSQTELSQTVTELEEAAEALLMKLTGSAGSLAKGPHTRSFDPVARLQHVSGALQEATISAGGLRRAA